MKAYSLNVKKRGEREKGKNKAGRLRRKGWIPANLLSKEGSSLLSFEEKDLGSLVNAGLRSSSIVKLEMAEEGSTEAVVKELQRNPINGRILHVDFYKVTKGKKLSVKIAIEPQGLAKGVKAGGALEQYIHNISVRTVPEALAEVIEVDVTNLDKGEALYFNDLNIPKEWETRIEGNPIVLKVARARVVMAETPETEEKKEAAKPTQEEEAKPSPKS